MHENITGKKEPKMFKNVEKLKALIQIMKYDNFRLFFGKYSQLKQIFV